MRRRGLSEIQNAGDVRWFEPALDRLRMLPTDSDERAKKFLESKAAVVIARAPGRLDVIGGIADYSGATVLQLPLDRATFVVLQRQTAAQCDVLTRRGDDWNGFDMDLARIVSGDLRSSDALAAWFRGRPDDHWAAYVIGAVQYCLSRAKDSRANDMPGLRLLIESTVPEGKGVSSSAAIEVAVMTAVAASFGYEMTSEALATACQWVENHVVGAPCGIMDQMTSACGQTNRLLRLRCQPAAIEGYLEIPNGYRFFGIDSGVRHAVTGADYASVRTAAFMGYRMIADIVGLRAEIDGGVAHISDDRWNGYLANISAGEFRDLFESRLPDRISGSEFLARYGGITDFVTRVFADGSYPVRVSTAHPVYEQSRIMRFADGLSRLSADDSVAEDMGRLMYESHASYSACGLGSPGTDRLVDLVREMGPRRGLYGAKITGGGSGGTVAVFARADAGDAIDDVARRYAVETGRVPEVFRASGPGAAELGALVLERD